MKLCVVGTVTLWKLIMLFVIPVIIWGAIMTSMFIGFSNR